MYLWSVFKDFHLQDKPLCLVWEVRKYWEMDSHTVGAGLWMRLVVSKINKIPPDLSLKGVYDKGRDRYLIQSHSAVVFDVWSSCLSCNAASAPLCPNCPRRQHKHAFVHTVVCSPELRAETKLDVARCLSCQFSSSSLFHPALRLVNGQIMDVNSISLSSLC